MAKYVCIHQNYQGPIKTLKDISKELRTQGSSQTFAQTIYYVSPDAKPPFGTGIYEVQSDGTLKLVQENFDTSD